MRIPRRKWLTSGACATFAGLALGMGRKPHAGRLRLCLPWALDGIDPHDANDPAAAFFGGAIASPLYAIDPSARVYPTLAAALPDLTPTGATLTLRAGLAASNGRALDARDLVFSLERARRLGGNAVLGRFARPRRIPGDALSVHFERADPVALAHALSSPLCALVPRDFSPRAPQGTGAFRARLDRGALSLERNPYAPRGPAWLDRIEVATVADLAEALRRFEAGEVDLGWLGRGLHRPRENSRLVAASDVGWVVLRAGRRAGRWGGPGAIAGLLANLAPSQLERFGLGAPNTNVRPYPYAGPDCELLTRDDSSYLLELGRTLAELLGSASSRVTLKPIPIAQLREAKRSGDYGFLLDIVRSLGPSVHDAQLSLLQEQNPELTRNPPTLPPNLAEGGWIEHTTRTLNLGVVGSLRVLVAHSPEVRGLEGWDLGDVWIA